MQDTTTAPRKPRQSKKVKPATRLTRNDKQVLKRAHVVPRHKNLKVKTSRKEQQDESMER